LPPISPYVLHGTIAAFLPLAAFNLALGLILSVGTTRETSDPTRVDPRSRWPLMRLIALCVLAVPFALVAAFIAIPIAAPAILLGVSDGIDGFAVLAHGNLLVPVGIMALLAALQTQVLFEQRTTQAQPASHRARRRSSATRYRIADARWPPARRR